MVWPVFTIRRASSTPLGNLRPQCSKLAAGLLFGCFVLTAAGTARAQEQSAQDVAEAARQERARKQPQKPPVHVYTNEDLRRGKILTPEDQSRAATNRQQPVHPNAKENAAPLDASSDPTSQTLGEVARRYRNAKRGSPQPSPFHLPSDTPSLAAPKPSTPAFAPVPKKFLPSRPGLLPTPKRTPSSNQRIDPFARRLPLGGALPLSDRPLIAAPRSFTRSSPPAVNPQPISPARFVTVQPGDSLWKIARRTLGHGANWHELMVANPRVINPTRLALGTQLVVPAQRTLRNTRADRITIQPGDTLSAIALAHFGHASRWHCIAQANPNIDDAARIYAGQSLLLPASCQP